MFSFFKKFKQVSDADGDGKGDKAGASPATPARRKDKSNNREQEVGNGPYDSKMTETAVSGGATRKETERKSGDVKEQLSVHQRGEKNGSQTVKDGERKVPVQETGKAKVVGSVTAVMTWTDEAVDDVGKMGDLAKSEATHTKREAGQDKERIQKEAERTVTAGSQRNVLMSRATPVHLTMGTKTLVEERPTADNEVKQNVSECGAVLHRSGRKFTAMDEQVEKLTDVMKQMEELENEK
jgi:hypothetical protein